MLLCSGQPKPGFIGRRRLPAQGQAPHNVHNRNVRMCDGSAQSGNIVVVGSINTDLVLKLPRIPAPGETLAAEDMQRFPGGKGANQAAASGQLGCPTTMVGQIGDDVNGKYMMDALSDANVSLDTVTTIPEVSTGSAVILLQPGGENSIIIVGGANKADWAFSEEQSSTIRAASALLLQREIPDSVNAEAAAIAREGGATVVLDAGGAEGPLGSQLLSNVTVMSPNETELARMTNMATDTEDHILEAAKQLQADGASAVLVKLGSKGSMMLTEDGEVIKQGAMPVDDIVDTTGAGDCFTAAFAVSLVRGQDFSAAMRYAAAAAALSIQRMGAMSSLPSDEEVQKLLNS